MLLSAAVPEIEAALRRLLEKPWQHRPFVRVEDTVTGAFVQFVGSDREPLRIDVPALRIVEPVEVERGAMRAVETLRGFGLPDFAELEIVEERGLGERGDAPPS